MGIRVEKSCPIPNSHNRLRQTHDLWHEMQIAYPDADAFVTKLNACVQAARSVTFVLQKELSKQPWFAEWYEPRRTRMRDDTRMRWLVDARNRIEKEGDLDTASIALVSVLLTDEERLVSRMEVPPLAGPAEIAETVRIAELPERIRNQAVMAVERRWTVPELADDELLDALSYCYGHLATMIVEVHERCGTTMQTFGGETHEGPHDRRPHPSGRLPCMLPTAEARTAYWHLGEQTLLRHTTEAVERAGAEALEQAADRYGIRDGQHELLPGQPLAEQASTAHNLARRILEVDGNHATFAWLYRDQSRILTLMFEFEDQQDKIVKIRRIAQEVQRTGADAVLFTGEMWIASEVDADDQRFELRAGERADRAEGLVTYLLRRDGEHLSWITVLVATTAVRRCLRTSRSSRTSGVAPCSVLCSPSGRSGMTPCAKSGQRS
ncbi:MAG TPA: hypothetical protein VGX72_14525 [Solirubrobacteraceae bacterium]|nr:hypothetical protein [Solirubrobacteraceae bacterium]